MYTVHPRVFQVKFGSVGNKLLFTLSGELRNVTQLISICPSQGVKLLILWTFGDNFWESNQLNYHAEYLPNEEITNRLGECRSRTGRVYPEDYRMRGIKAFDKSLNVLDWKWEDDRVDDVSFSGDRFSDYAHDRARRLTMSLMGKLTGGQWPNRPVATM